MRRHNKWRLAIQFLVGLANAPLLVPQHQSIESNNRDNYRRPQPQPTRIAGNTTVH